MLPQSSEARAEDEGRGNIVVVDNVVILSCSIFVVVECFEHHSLIFFFFRRNPFRWRLARSVLQPAQ